MQYSNENTTDYLFRIRNAHKVNESCNESLIAKGVQEHGMNMIFPLNNTEFDSLQEDEKKEAENQDKKCYARSYIWRTQTKPGLPIFKSVMKMTMC